MKKTINRKIKLLRGESTAYLPSASWSSSRLFFVSRRHTIPDWMLCYELMLRDEFISFHSCPTLIEQMHWVSSKLI